jgi:hypothetical protein
MTMRDQEGQVNENEGEDIASLREAELAEAEEMQSRGTLTPEGAKQGVTSHLPAEETEAMYRSDDEDRKPEGRKTA